MQTTDKSNFLRAEAELVIDQVRLLHTLLRAARVEKAQTN